MALLFTFVLFGASVVWSGLTIMSPVTLGFTALVFLARLVAFVPALLPARIPWRSRLLIAWFGPRGLSSLLLVLVAVFAQVPGGAPNWCRSARSSFCCPFWSTGSRHFC